MTEKQIKQFQIIVDTIVSHNPTILSRESIQEMVKQGLIDFDMGARAIESYDKETAITSSNNNDEEAKNLIGAKDIKIDAMLKMAEENDPFLYKTYRKTLKDLENIVSEMLSNVGADFSSRMGDIQSVIAQSNGDNKEQDINKLKEIDQTNIKIL